jgi:hypothetical protein
MVDRIAAEFDALSYIFRYDDIGFHFYSSQYRRRGLLHGDQFDIEVGFHIVLGGKVPIKFV